MKRTKFKDAVVESVKEEIRKRKEEQEKLFQELYDKKRIYDFPPDNEINMVKHFYFPKFPDLNKRVRAMTKAALAVYPVLCTLADFEKNDWFQCAQENIAKMAGISVNTVAKGIEDLVTNKFCLMEDNVRIPLLERNKTTEGKRHFYLYRVGFIRKESIEKWKGSFFIFHTCIIHSGVWADLTPRAKALYLAMRSTAHLDFDEYYSFEYPGMEFEPYEEQLKDRKEYYRTRKWDFCNVSLSELSRLVNISSANIQKTMQQLEHHKLAERIDQWIKVYLKPKSRKSREYIV